MDDSLAPHSPGTELDAISLPLLLHLEFITIPAGGYSIPAGLPTKPSVISVLLHGALLEHANR